MEVEIQQESEEESVRRSQVLSEVKKIFLDWVKYVAIEVVHLPEEEAMDVGGELFVSGSHKLNVREPGADIDTICVAPNFCLREHFFSSLKDRLLAHPDVTNLTSVEAAKVPLITFDFREVNIDFLFARMAENTIPNDINDRIFEDEILKNLDEASVMSVNGPRATYMISRLVPNYDNFLTVLRCIRVWAKRRGLYGNKYGYLGGINCNILVAFVCQLFPEACPSTLLHRFFRVYSSWSWPSPIQLNHIKPNMPGDDFHIWSEDYDYKDRMPMITPAYPAMNSSKSVSENSLRVMTNEFIKGNEIMTKIIAEGGEGWNRLFVPSGFFVDYSHYLACHILCSNEVREERSREWKGLLQSLMRFFPDHLQQLPIEHIHLYPKEFPSTKSDNINSCCYYIGFDMDHSAMHDNEVNIFQCEQEFWDKRLSYFESDPDDPEDSFDFVTEPLKFKTLPDEVFQSLGGRGCAKMMRDMGRDAARAKAAAVAAAPPPATAATATAAATPSSAASAAGSMTTPAKNKNSMEGVTRAPGTTPNAGLMTPQVIGSTAKEILSNTLATLLSSNTGVSKKATAGMNSQNLRKRKGSGGIVDSPSGADMKKTRIIQEMIHLVGADGRKQGIKSAAALPKRTVAILLPEEHSNPSVSNGKNNRNNLRPVPSISWDLAK
jgi:poly(A) polymerase